MNPNVSFFLLTIIWTLSAALNLKHLDPIKLQTRTPSDVQQKTATKIIKKYSDKVTVQVDHRLFEDHKDVFILKTVEGKLNIRASTGVAAVWGFNYYMKKYCKSHYGWQVKRIAIPEVLLDVDEKVVANDRFRYYENVCTVSYSFVWWNITQWEDHVEWMALNGINLALAPVDQEAVWAKVYKEIGMTDTEIDKQFTGPAFLTWLRMGNFHGWGGPLLKSWHDRQTSIQLPVIWMMYNLGIIPVLPAFSGHVPKAFLRIYPNSTFEEVSRWVGFSNDYCCGLFIDPSDPLFRSIGKLYLNEMTRFIPPSHIYSADPFNEVTISQMTRRTIRRTAKAIFSAMYQVDHKAVWLVQNWMFVNDPEVWKKKGEAFLRAVPNGRLLVLDLMAEAAPQFENFSMYYGQPFIWCMLHDFGGTLGMVGKMHTIIEDVYKARTVENSTMLGIGLTMEGINTNYVVYDLMLETAWRNDSSLDLDVWVGEYAERRYGCNETTTAWIRLVNSVYDFNDKGLYGYNPYIMTQKPTLYAEVSAWYESADIFNALQSLIGVSRKCDSPGFRHDLVDVTRQALQYRAEQIYLYRLKNYYFFDVPSFANCTNEYLDVLTDMEMILASNDDFTAAKWLDEARSVAADSSEYPIYDLNARNQITLWGPNGEISDYARKQWAEVFHYYYIPRWRAFLTAALNAKINGTIFDEKAAQRMIQVTIEKKFATVKIDRLPKKDSWELARTLFAKWNHTDLGDLPPPGLW